MVQAGQKNALDLIELGPLGLLAIDWRALWFERRFPRVFRFVYCAYVDNHAKLLVRQVLK